MERRRIEVNGASLAVYEQPGDEPAVLLCHATGFHARTWNAIAERLPNRRVISFDMRGHGQSSKPEPPIPWRQFGLDAAQLAGLLQLRNAVSVGHSMGGHSAVLASALVPEAFSQLLLLDPVIIPEDQYTGPIQEPHYARKRRNRWDSPAAMLERFRTRPPFNTWDPRVLEDYCIGALEPAPDGVGYVLACSPETEGSIYEHSLARDSNIYPEIAQVGVPVLVIRSANSPVAGPAMDMAASPTAPDLASRFRVGRDLVVPYSHFIPMEAPAFVAGQILTALTTESSKPVAGSPDTPWPSAAPSPD